VKLLQAGPPKLVELFGQAAPVPNAPKSIKIKVTPDKATETIKVESVDNSMFDFQNEYKLSPAKDGKGTIVKYTSVSNDLSKALGIELPTGMRKQIALKAFMEQLHRVGDYIDEQAKAKGGSRS